MPDLSRITSFVFSIFFISVLFSFIFRVLKEMNEERKRAESKSAPEGISRWYLEILGAGENTGFSKGQLISLEGGLTMGRKEDNDIILDDPFSSFYHVRFFLRNGRYVIEDLKSTNGTLLNGQEIKQKTYLKLGDEIEVGSAFFKAVRQEQ